MMPGTKGILFMLAVLPFVAAPEAAQGFAIPAAFHEGNEAYRDMKYQQAATLFRQAAAASPASGTLQNLGNAEWQSGRTGQAILAWEQARWLNPFNDAARNNLRFARKVAQLEAPDLAWYEVVSSWLPFNWWAWIAGISFWFAVGVGTLPGILRLRKAVWQQALAAFALAVFLLSVPAHLGVNSRSHIGFVLEKNAPLRLTATEEAQYVTRLQAGEPARLERVRGHFILIRTNRTLGWIHRDQFGLTCMLDISGTAARPSPPPTIAVFQDGPRPVPGRSTSKRGGLQISGAAPQACVLRPETGRGPA
jgi:hypothetical protein